MAHLPPQDMNILASPSGTGKGINSNGVGPSAGVAIAVPRAEEKPRRSLKRLATVELPEISYRDLGPGNVAMGSQVCPLQT